jgi:IS5 family transposase
MDDQVTTIYCLSDDFLHDLGHNEPPENTVSDAEVLTVALTAARFFGGNYEAAWRFLLDHRYLMRRLSPSQFSRRLDRALPLAERLFLWLGELWKRTGEEGVFIVDSMPFACCENIRIPRSRLYPLEETESAFRGYIASKRQYFYGVKAHVVVNEHGLPVEAHLAPGSHNDTAELKNFALDLPSGAVVYGDKAYGNDYLTEDLLAEAGEVALVGQRRKNSKRPLPACVSYVLEHFRKRIETAFSRIERRLPKSIHAVTARGFETKVFLFLLSFSLDGLM